MQLVTLEFGKSACKHTFVAYYTDNLWFTLTPHNKWRRCFPQHDGAVRFSFTIKATSLSAPLASQTAVERKGVIGVWDSMRGWSVWCPLLWSEVHHWHHPSAQPPLWQPAQVLARPAANTAAAEWKNAAGPPTLCHLHPSLAKTPQQKLSSRHRFCFSLVCFIYFWPVFSAQILCSTF